MEELLQSLLKSVKTRLIGSLANGKKFESWDSSTVWFLRNREVLSWLLIEYSEVVKPGDAPVVDGESVSFLPLETMSPARFACGAFAFISEEKQ